MQPDRDLVRSSDVLNGWKEIANFLGKGLRTVQRYEREEQLPVHRPPGRQSVMCTKAELVAWIAASPQRESRAQFSPRNVHAPARIAGMNDGIMKMVQLCESIVALRQSLLESLIQYQTVEGLTALATRVSTPSHMLNSARRSQPFPPDFRRLKTSSPYRPNPAVRICGDD
jgi:predicted DNA-binding transcriptional regulator AlpA